MKFGLIPTIDIMHELYQKPRNIERFNEFLRLLKGNSEDDMVLPIGGFNPMAKEHLAEKLQELKNLNCEAIAKETLEEINSRFSSHPNKDLFKVAINVLDDLKGAWTNFYTSDYDSKFKLNAIVKRRFCVPVLWSAETYTEELIRERIWQYAARTIYWLEKPKPATLKEHIEQEKFVANVSGKKSKAGNINPDELNAYYNKHRLSEDYHIIFNFFYGDEACASLGFPQFGVKGKMPGYAFAASL